MNKKELFQYLKFCLKKRNDERFVKNLYQLGNDYSLVNLQKMGGNQGGIRYFHIGPDASGSGFFADHNRLLCYLYYADYYGLIPVVEYGDGYSYAEKEPVNGTRNPFEYYFEQPGGVSVEQLKAQQSVIKSRKENAALAGTLNASGNGYDWSEEYLEEMGRISAKYIHLNSETKKWMTDQIDSTIRGKRAIGVHVRGTDFKRNYKGHPVKIGTEEYLEAAKKMFAAGKYDMVFLATDDSEAIDRFRETFGEKLVYYRDVIRSSGDETVMKSREERESHHYLLGREVLRDAWTLGSCQGLIAGLSQVSFGARIFKAASNTKYEDFVLLDNGMNKR